MARTNRPTMHTPLGTRLDLAGALVTKTGEAVVGEVVVSAARDLGCRPAQLRRCLQGRPVSVGAARRIFAAAGVAA